MNMMKSIIKMTAAVMITATMTWAQFSGGDGSDGNPWIITTPAQLNAVRNYLGDDHADKHFKLGDDIDLSDFIKDNEDDDEGWLPIGNTDTRFTGSLDGNGFVIR